MLNKIYSKIFHRMIFKVRLSNYFMQFRKGNKKDIQGIRKVKVDTFSKFNSSESFKKGAVSKYLKRFKNKSDSELLASFEINKDSILFVAVKNKKIMGYIKGTIDRIENLFILGKFHNKGIGKKLVNLLEKESIKNRRKEIKVDSSIYAISFYQKLGFKKTTRIKRNKFDLKVQPMKKILN